MMPSGAHTCRRYEALYRADVNNIPFRAIALAGVLVHRAVAAIIEMQVSIWALCTDGRVLVDQRCELAHRGEHVLVLSRRQTQF